VSTSRSGFFTVGEIPRYPLDEGCVSPRAGLDPVAETNIPSLLVARIKTLSIVRSAAHSLC